MAGERQFEAAAERRAVNGGDDGFARGFDDRQDVRQRGRKRRLAEFLDVGAGDESAALAGDDDRLDGAVLIGGFDRRRQGPGGPPAKTR